MEARFVCPTCGATKTIVKRYDETVAAFERNTPINLVCGVKGCPTRAIRKHDEKTTLD